MRGWAPSCERSSSASRCSCSRGARRFAELGKVAVAFDEGQLPEKLEQLDRAVVTERIGPYAPDRLVGALRIFIDGGRVPAHAIEGGPMTAPASPAATV